MNLSSFYKVFIKPEFKTLLGKKWKIILLILIVSSSFWGLGLSNAIKYYLKQKMDNPFVKFVTINLPMKADINELKTDLFKFHGNKSAFTIKREKKPLY